jgi:hypothetical protein
VVLQHADSGPMVTRNPAVCNDDGDFFISYLRWSIVKHLVVSEKMRSPSQIGPSPGCLIFRRISGGCHQCDPERLRELCHRPTSLQWKGRTRRTRRSRGPTAGSAQNLAIPRILIHEKVPIHHKWLIATGCDLSTQHLNRVLPNQIYMTTSDILISWSNGSTWGPCPGESDEHFHSVSLNSASICFYLTNSFNRDSIEIQIPSTK